MVHMRTFQCGMHKVNRAISLRHMWNMGECQFAWVSMVSWVPTNISSCRGEDRKSISWNCLRWRWRLGHGQCWPIFTTYASSDSGEKWEMQMRFQSGHHSSKRETWVHVAFWRGHLLTLSHVILPVSQLIVFLNIIHD